MKDKLTVWPLFEGQIVLDHAYISEITHRTGLEIHLDFGEITKAEIIFQDFISYTLSDEGYLTKIWHQTDKHILGKVLYIVEDSSRTDFFHQMSEQIYSHWKIVHYAVYTDNECLDILSLHEPEIKWITE